MLVTILPFFLVANVTVDRQYEQTKWANYSSECTYDVLVNTSLANVVEEYDSFCDMIAIELKCRPKGEDSLSCHFQNSLIKRPDPEDNRCSNTSYKFVDDEPFEIRFNSKGIENLVVHRSILRWRLDMLKSIVSQLNVGFKMQEHRDRFTIMENSAVSRCEVDVKIIREDPDFQENDDDSIEESEKFEIGFMPSNVELERPLVIERLQVEKIRQPKRCPRMNMVTSTSHITISKDKFVSYTILEGAKTTNISRIFPYQKISLKLKRIDLVETSKISLPEIQNPASTSLFGFSNLQIPEDE